MSSELELAQLQGEQEKVVSLYARGKTISQIKSETGLANERIKQHLADFREFARNDKYMSARSREVVLVTDQHYSDIISQYYEAIKEAELAEDYKAQMSGLSAVAKIESDRVEFLRKAGIIADSHVGDMIAEAEREKEIIVGILRTISEKYPKVGLEIHSELSKLTNRAESVRVDLNG